MSNEAEIMLIVCLVIMLAVAAVTCWATWLYATEAVRDKKKWLDYAFKWEVKTGELRVDLQDERRESESLRSQLKNECRELSWANARLSAIAVLSDPDIDVCDAKRRKLAELIEAIKDENEQEDS